MKKLLKRQELANSREAIKNMKENKPINLTYEKSKKENSFFIGYDRLIPVLEIKLN